MNIEKSKKCVETIRQMETFVSGLEQLKDPELRVTVTGNQVQQNGLMAQAVPGVSMLVDRGNTELFDIMIENIRREIVEKKQELREEVTGEKSKGKFEEDIGKLVEEMERYSRDMAKGISVDALLDLIINETFTSGVYKKSGMTASIAVKSHNISGTIESEYTELEYDEEEITKDIMNYFRYAGINGTIVGIKRMGESE